MTNEEEIWLRICSIKCFLTFAIHFLSIFDFYVEFVTELLKQETMQDKRKRVREAKKKLKQEVSNDKDERKGKEFTGANI